MSAAPSLRSISDRTLNRLIIAIALVLLVGVPAVAAIYYFDRNVDAGPSLPDRNVASMEQAVRDNPNLVSSRLGLATSYTEARRWSDAIVQYGEVLRIDTANGGALLGRANASEQLGDVDAAAADYQAIIDSGKGAEMAKVNPLLESAYYRLGAIQLQQGKSREAIESFVAALKIDRGDADAMYLLGTAYLKEDEPEKAVFAFHEAVKFIPTGWCEPYQQMAQGFTALKQTEGVQYATGMAAFCAGRPEEGKAALQPLVDGQFGLDALLGLGYIAESQSDWSTAKDSFTRALAKDAQSFNANQGLNRANAALNGGPPPAASPATSASPAATGSN